jgi:transcriptional regulator with XRE-family HTH domain
VKELRGAFGMTQQSFAVMLGTALPTIGRYETDRSPKGRILVRFQELADQCGRTDLATIFRQALMKEIGVMLTEEVLRRRGRIKSSSEQAQAKQFIDQILTACSVRKHPGVSREKALESLSLIEQIAQALQHLVVAPKTRAALNSRLSSR